jgi:hypothetical protein
MQKQDNTPTKTRLRKNLNADALNAALRSAFGQVSDPRCQKDIKISLTDALVSGFAMFQFKDPSLLAFNERCKDEYELDNLKHLYGIERVPAYSSMSDILDIVSPNDLRKAFLVPFRALQRGKALEQFQVLGDHYLIALDGTGSFSSTKIKSASCQVKTNKKTGEKTYYQQVLGSALIHPDHKEVVPLAPEMIVPRDGDTKNDCERNGANRWLKTFREDHPYLKAIITEDALSSNAPHIRDLQAHNLRYILGVKPGDHEHLYAHVHSAFAQGQMTEITFTDPKDPKTTHIFHFINGVPLNKSNPDLLVNFVAQTEKGPKKDREFSWITDFEVTPENVWEIMRAGRSRWKIENETFNTLKNQGYHFEHNFGLGKKHLSEIYINLMMLAFLVDQTQQIACPLFQAVLKKLKFKKYLWEKMRIFFRSYIVYSITDIFNAILYGRGRVELRDLTPG